MRSTLGLIGLTNLGNTCYLSSFVQCIYSSITFTQQLLSINNVPPNSVLYNLQKLFSYLLLSQRSSYAPTYVIFLFLLFIIYY